VKRAPRGCCPLRSLAECSLTTAQTSSARGLGRWFSRNFSRSTAFQLGGPRRASYAAKGGHEEWPTLGRLCMIAGESLGRRWAAGKFSAGARGLPATRSTRVRYWKRDIALGLSWTALDLDNNGPLRLLPKFEGRESRWSSPPDYRVVRHGPGKSRCQYPRAVSPSIRIKRGWASLRTSNLRTIIGCWA